MIFSWKGVYIFLVSRNWNFPKMFSLFFNYVLLHRYAVNVITMYVRWFRVAIWEVKFYMLWRRSHTQPCCVRMLSLCVSMSLACVMRFIQRWTLLSNIILIRLKIVVFREYANMRIVLLGCINKKTFLISVL